MKATVRLLNKNPMFDYREFCKVTQGIMLDTVISSKQLYVNVLSITGKNLVLGVKYDKRRCNYY